MPMPLIPLDTAAGAGTPEGRRPRIVPAPAAVSPEISARPRRRTYTVQDKLRILAETDRAADTGQIGAILRREGLYSSILGDTTRPGCWCAASSMTAPCLRKSCCEGRAPATT